MESDKPTESSSGVQLAGLTDKAAAYEEPRKSYSPVRLLSLTVGSIFITETVVMLVLFRLPAVPYWAGALIDGSLLALLLFPMLYYVLFLPMESYIEELSRTGRRLQSEIADRRRIEHSLLESEKDLRRLSSELLAAHEKEKRLMSIELHEDLAQSLAAVKLGLRSINTGWRRSKPEVREEWERTMGTIDQAIMNIRRMSRALGPSIVEDFGLLDAVQRQVRHVMKGNPLEVSLDLVEVDPSFDQKSQMIIFRVLQEAISNVGQHSGAAHLMIVVRREGDQFVFRVRDDGKGFDVDHLATDSSTRNGLGLATMSEGARMVGGAIVIQSEPGKGTVVTLSVPTERALHSSP